MKAAFAACVALLAGDLTSVSATTANPLPFVIVQPNGKMVGEFRNIGGPSHTCIVRGDYAVLMDTKGYAVYAKADYTSSMITVGGTNPDLYNIPKNVPCVDASAADIFGEGFKVPREIIGTVKNLVVPVRFLDHRDRVLPSRSDIDILMNHVGPHSKLAPTGSVRDVFLQNSYEATSIDSTVIDWITLPETEAYYSDGAKGLNGKFKEAIVDALTVLNRNSFGFQAFNNDSDDVIDSITFFHSGYAAEHGGTSCDKVFQSDRIWSHNSFLGGNGFNTWDGVKVEQYTINPALWGRGCENAIGRIGVVAHEMALSMGLPSDSDTGNFGLESSSWGFRGDQLHPPLLSPYSKIQLGWVRPGHLTKTGVHSLKASGAHKHVYQISRGFPDGEYLLIEFRQNHPGGFEALPNAGLIIYHVVHDQFRQTVIQADGRFDIETDINSGDQGDFWNSNSLQTELGPCLANCTYPNTNSYENSDQQTGIRIYDVSSPSSSSDRVTFTVSFDDEVVSYPSASPTISHAPTTAVPTASPTTPLPTETAVAQAVDAEADTTSQLNVNCEFTRYKTWNNLNSEFKDAAKNLEYGSTGWNRFTNAVEGLRWTDLNSKYKENAEILNFNPDSWDCFQNHYRAYAWSELKELGLVQYYETLGWTKDMWKNGDTEPATEGMDWDDLTNAQERAAKKLCYFDSTWDKIKLTSDDFKSKKCRILD